jgi:hypothetical protein
VNREKYGCVTNENFVTRIKSSRNDTVYEVRYGKFPELDSNGDIKEIWRWNCECPSWTMRRNPCKHLSQAKQEYCGWQENLVYEPPLEMEYLDEKSGEALCPLCDRLAYPLSVLKNKYDHNSSVLGDENAD